MKTKALVVLSGGQDSVTCLGYAIRRYPDVEAISFSYGQKHSVELKCAKAVCARYDIPHKIVDISFIKNLVVSNLFEGSDSVNEPHPDNDKLPSSFVPNRNALFLTLAHGFAQTIKAGSIITGVCQTDYSGYPDCRNEFIISLQATLNIGSEQGIIIEAPLMYKTKAETFAFAEELEFLNEVVRGSHTCYNGEHEKLHEWGYGCGDCPACKVRAKGWAEYVLLGAKQ